MWDNDEEEKEKEEEGQKADRASTSIVYSAPSR